MAEKVYRMELQMTSRSGQRDNGNVPDVLESIQARSSEKHAEYDRACATRESSTWYAGMDDGSAETGTGKIRVIPRKHGFNLFTFLFWLALVAGILFILANLFVSLTLMLP